MRGPRWTGQVYALLLLAALHSSAALDEFKFKGTSWVPPPGAHTPWRASSEHARNLSPLLTRAAPAPAGIRICVTDYAPYVVNGTSAGSSGSPVDFDQIALLFQPGRSTSPSDPDFSLAGYDVDYACVPVPQRLANTPQGPPDALTALPLSLTPPLRRLVFEQMLGVNTTFVSYASFVGSYLAVREGTCDVAITAAEVDPYRLLCSSDCPAVPPGGFNLASSDDYSSDAIQEQVCCLDFSVPYLNSGFALASKVRPRHAQLDAIFFVPRVINVGAMLLIMMMSVGWLMAFLEVVCPVVPAMLGVEREMITTPSMGVYWSMTTMTTVGFGDAVPVTHPGRALASMWMLVSLLTVCVFCGLIGASITADALNFTFVSSISEMTDTLCHEVGYPLALTVVQREAVKPPVVQKENVHACMKAMERGEVQAVMADRPSLLWYAQTYSSSDIHVSPVIASNPFAFAFASGSPWRSFVNPAIVASLTESDWSPLTASISTSYFSASTDSTEFGVATQVDRALVTTVLVLAGATLLVSPSDVLLHRIRERRKKHGVQFTPDNHHEHGSEHRGIEHRSKALRDLTGVADAMHAVLSRLEERMHELKPQLQALHEEQSPHHSDGSLHVQPHEGVPESRGSMLQKQLDAEAASVADKLTWRL